MSTPSRITLSRAKGWRLPPNTVKVDRTTKWGNPFKVAEYTDCRTPSDAVRFFRNWLKISPLGRELAVAAKRDLRGKNLACWCAQPKPGEPDLCHAAVLLHLANA